MVKVTISVILPVYNEETYITEAIDSILNQTFIDFELIIVDDASDDETSKRILEYADTRIVYKRNEHNLGNYPARNIGIQLAKGKYVAVMDSDDIAYPERLQKEYEYLEKHPDILAVGSECTINGQLLKRKLPTDYEDILVTLLRVNCCTNFRKYGKAKAIRLALFIMACWLVPLAFFIRKSFVLSNKHRIFIKTNP